MRGDGLDDIESKQALIDLIYSQPLEHRVKFINVQTCGSTQLGHDSEVCWIHIFEKDYKTYGDVMSRFGHREGNREKGEVEYYSYPDSVWLFLKHVTKLPESIHEKGEICSKKKVPCEIKLDPNTVYLTYFYDR